jgi:hypothetical protein
MDSLRQYLEMPESAAHTALADVEDTGKIVARFLKYHKTLAGKNKFKGAMREEQ